MMPCLTVALLAISYKVRCSPHEKAIYFCPAPILAKLCPHMQSSCPAIFVFVFPSSFLSLVAIQWWCWYKSRGLAEQGQEEEQENEQR